MIVNEDADLDGVGDLSAWTGSVISAAISTQGVNRFGQKISRPAPKRPYHENLEQKVSPMTAAIRARTGGMPLGLPAGWGGFIGSEQPTSWGNPPGNAARKLVEQYKQQQIEQERQVLAAQASQQLMHEKMYHPYVHTPMDPVKVAMLNKEEHLRANAKVAALVKQNWCIVDPTYKGIMMVMPSRGDELVKAELLARGWTVQYKAPKPKKTNPVLSPGWFGKAIAEAGWTNYGATGHPKGLGMHLMQKPPQESGSAPSMAGQKGTPYLCPPNVTVETGQKPFTGPAWEKALLRQGKGLVIKYKYATTYGGKPAGDREIGAGIQHRSFLEPKLKEKGWKEQKVSYDWYKERYGGAPPAGVSPSMLGTKMGATDLKEMTVLMPPGGKGIVSRDDWMLMAQDVESNPIRPIEEQELPKAQDEYTIPLDTDDTPVIKDVVVTGPNTVAPVQDGEEGDGTVSVEEVKEAVKKGKQEEADEKSNLPYYIGGGVVLLLAGAIVTVLVVKK